MFNYKIKDNMALFVLNDLLGTSGYPRCNVSKHNIYGKTK